MPLYRHAQHATVSTHLRAIFDWVAGHPVAGHEDLVRDHHFTDDMLDAVIELVEGELGVRITWGPSGRHRVDRIIEVVQTTLGRT